MIRILADRDDAALLVAACLISAGLYPPPSHQQALAFKRLADDLGDGLDQLPAREVPDDSD